MLSLVEISTVVLGKQVLNFVNLFLVFRNYLPFEKNVALYLNKHESPLPKDTFSNVGLKFAPCFWRRRILNLLFLLFRNYFPLKSTGSFIWTYLNTRRHCVTFGWNLPGCSGEENFKNLVNVFSLFRNYLPLEKWGALRLNKLESSSPKNALCYVWLELAIIFFTAQIPIKIEVRIIDPSPAN